MDEPSTSFAHANQFSKIRRPAPKPVGNSFIQFTTALQQQELIPHKIFKKQNAPDFVPLPIPKNLPVRPVSLLTNNPIHVKEKEKITLPEEEKKPEIKVQDLVKTMKIATGTVETTLKWFKKFDSQLMLYEVYANILSIRDGKHKTEKLLLLRNSTGPVLQAVFYAIDFEFPTVESGDLVRCIGRCLDNSRLHILKIKKSTAKEMENAARLMAICNFSFNK